MKRYLECAHPGLYNDFHMPSSFYIALWSHEVVLIEGLGLCLAEGPQQPELESLALSIQGSLEMGDDPLLHGWPFATRTPCISIHDCQHDTN